MVGRVSRDHRQQVYQSGDMSSKTAGKSGNLDIFSYSPPDQAVSSNNAHYTYISMQHEHNHMVLMRKSAPQTFDPMPVKEMDMNGEFDSDMNLFRIPVVEEEVEEEIVVPEP